MARMFITNSSLSQKQIEEILRNYERKHGVEDVCNPSSTIHEVKPADSKFFPVTTIGAPNSEQSSRDIKESSCGDCESCDCTGEDEPWASVGHPGDAASLHISALGPDAIEFIQSVKELVEQEKSMTGFYPNLKVSISYSESTTNVDTTSTVGLNPYLH